MSGVRQQGPLTPGRRRLRALSSLEKAGRAPTWQSNDPRAVASFRQPYTITRGWREYYFTTGAQASLTALPSLTAFLS